MTTLTDSIAKRLRQDLPGETAHRKMMSYQRETANQIHNSGIRVKQSAVSLCLFQRDEIWHTVFTLRQSYKGVHSNQVSFPGGRLEEKESHEAAALRETYEEVGALPENSEVIGQLSEIYIPPSKFLVQPFITLLTKEPNWNAQEREVKQILTPELNTLLSRDIIVERDIELSHYNTTLRVPTFDVQGHVVWGATAMIWSEFMDVMSDIDLGL